MRIAGDAEGMAAPLVVSPEPRRDHNSKDQQGEADAEESFARQVKGEEGNGRDHKPAEGITSEHKATEKQAADGGGDDVEGKFSRVAVCLLFFCVFGLAATFQTHEAVDEQKEEKNGKVCGKPGEAELP